MSTYYAYSDSESQDEIEAGSIQEAAEQFGIPTRQEIADGAFLVVRDEETHEEKTWGTVAR